MSYIVIKDGDNVEIIGEEDFSIDKNEKYLHELVEKNPRIILKEITEKDAITLASHLKLPSGGELDLLLVDSDGGLIVVELKKGKGHREAIAQLLDYASDLQQMDETELLSATRFKSIEDIYKSFYDNEEDFPYDEFKRNFLESITEPTKIQLLLVSYTIGDDTVRLVNWLRRLGVNISCVEFDYFKSGNKEIFVPKPLNVEETKRAERTLTETKEKYLRFFSDVLSSFKEIKPGATERKPVADSWLQIPAGFSSIHFEWWFRGKEPKKVLEVGLHFERPKEEDNQKLLEYFKSKELTLKKELEDLKFGKFGRKWRKIYVEKDIGSLDNALESEEIKNWAVETMAKFYELFKESGELNTAVQTLREMDS